MRLRERYYALLREINIGPIIKNDLPRMKKILKTLLEIIEELEKSGE